MWNDFTIGRRILSDPYHAAMTVRWSVLVSVLAVGWLALNVVFAGLYALDPGGVSAIQSGVDYLFFSIQTSATVGYGRMAPVSTYAHVLTSLQTLLALVQTAVMTGLIVAKLARPSPRVTFSDQPVITRNQAGQPVLTFRISNDRGNPILDARIKLAMTCDANGTQGPTRTVRDLVLVRAESPLFALTMTVQHVIDATSPLYGATVESLTATRSVLLATFSGHDSVLGQMISAYRPWAHTSIAWEHDLVPAFDPGSTGQYRLDLTRFHAVRPRAVDEDDLELDAEEVQS